jgi:hypothetical protein
MSQLPEAYVLDIFAHFATKHTGDTFKVTAFIRDGQELYDVTRNGVFMARALNEQEVRRLLIKYVPTEMVKDTPKNPRKKRK